MELLRILGIGVVTAVLSVLIKQHRPELAMAIPVLGGITIFLLVVPYLQEAVVLFGSLAEMTGIKNRHLQLILKMIGVAYLCEFSADLCRDVGETSVAGKIELGGKLLILSLSLPIVGQFMELVEAMIRF